MRIKFPTATEPAWELQPRSSDCYKRHAEQWDVYTYKRLTVWHVSYCLFVWSQYWLLTIIYGTVIYLHIYIFFTIYIISYCPHTRRWFTWNKNDLEKVTQRHEYYNLHVSWPRTVCNSMQFKHVFKRRRNYNSNESDKITVCWQ